jgi:hypothetical protein
VGTFGTGAFSSDGALDFLSDLAERPAELRAAALEHMFQFIHDNPDRLWQEFFTDEVIAATAVVAATLPGGEPFQQSLAMAVETSQSEKVDHGLPRPAGQLAAAARSALLQIEDAWMKGWADESSTAEARATFDILERVLSAEVENGGGSRPPAV